MDDRTPFAISVQPPRNTSTTMTESTTGTCMELINTTNDGTDTGDGINIHIDKSLTDEQLLEMFPSLCHTTTTSTIQNADDIRMTSDSLLQLRLGKRGTTGSSIGNDSVNSTTMMENSILNNNHNNNETTNVFNSGVWASMLRPSHQEVDYTHIFHLPSTPPLSSLSSSLPVTVNDVTTTTPTTAAASTKLIPTTTTTTSSTTMDNTNIILPTDFVTSTMTTNNAVHNDPSLPEFDSSSDNAKNLFPTTALHVDSATTIIGLNPSDNVQNGSRPSPPGRKQRKTKNTTLELRQYVETMTEYDVLMGRGGRTNHHKGNERYLQLKERIQPLYLKATKEEKTGISQQLVDAVQIQGGRFLKLDETHDRWYVVDNTTARKKASQTLREINTPQVRAAKRAKYCHPKKER